MLHRLPPLAPLAARLDRARAARTAAVLAAHDARARAVRDACARLRERDCPDAHAALDAHVPALLAALRREPDRGPLDRAARRLDALVRSDRPEYLDRDDVSGGVKRFSMRLLHRVNLALGSYGLFRDAVVRALGPLPFAHVYDLAAGTGGFARYLARAAPASPSLRITSSDLDPGYVALGARVARREGLAVAFEVRDALDLRAVRGVDLFLCTQATHHLGPARVLRMISQAIAVAPRGVLVIDLMRAATTALGAGPLVASVAPFPPLVLDGVQSVRRSYTPAELALLADLAGATRVEAHALGAAHCVLHAMQ